MGFSLGHVHNSGEIAVSIKTGVQFDGTFGFPEGSPGKNLQAEIDCRCIEQVDLAIKLESMARRKLLASAKQGGEQFLIELMWLLVIDFSQMSLRDFLQPKVIETASLGLISSVRSLRLFLPEG